MRKSTVVRVFISSLAGMAASVVLFIGSAALAVANDVFVMDGPDVVGLNSSPFGWMLLALTAVAVLGLLAGIAAQVVAWVGALLNTAPLPDKTWFAVILAGGLVGLGFFVTLAYVIGGPTDEPPVAGVPESALTPGTARPATEPHSFAHLHHG